MEHIGDSFQQRTKYVRRKMPGKPLDPSSQPPLYKDYPDSEKIELPPFERLDTGSLSEAIGRRRSVRNFAHEPISLQALSLLLWASTGISRRRAGCDFRTAPSAGALYPVETYLVVNRVDQLRPGIYHYNVRQHALDVLKQGEFAADIARAALDQGMCARAAVVFIWSAVFQRSKWKYDQRAYRYVYLDAGHIAENLALTAVGLGLGTCQIAALYDDEVNALIGLDGQAESVIYMSVVGPLARGSLPVQHGAGAKTATR